LEKLSIAGVRTICIGLTFLIKPEEWRVIYWTKVLIDTLVSRSVNAVFSMLRIKVHADYSCLPDWKWSSLNMKATVRLRERNDREPKVPGRSPPRRLVLQAFGGDS
jgi:hypothetical protein